MIAFKRGDVVLVAFPFTDLTTTKMRPALVISSDSFHRAGLDIILAGITSQITSATPTTDIPLPAEDQNRAGLRKPSLVRLGKIVTLDQRLVRRKLGYIPDYTLAQLTSVLHKILSPEPLNETPPSVHEPQAIYHSCPEGTRRAAYKARKPKLKTGRRKRK